MKTNVLTLFLALLFSSISYCHACSCMIEHPQEHYCSSDFVILGRVKKEQIVESTGTKVYKVRIRKQFKISEKGLVALKSGRLHTPIYDSMCGVSLQVGKLYVISGSISRLRAYVHLCDMILEWNEVSRRQKRGLKQLYKRGCTCSIKNCLYHWCNNSRQKDICTWRSKCESQEGICLRQASGSCMWNRNKMLTSCRLQEAQRRNFSISKPHHRIVPLPGVSLPIDP